MSIYRVYHIKDEFRRDISFGYLEPKFSEHYEHVADVDAPSLEDVWQLTNHVGGNWNENPEVTMKVEKARSSMVGDVFLIEDTAYQVAVVGFNMIGL